MAFDWAQGVKFKPDRQFGDFGLPGRPKETRRIPGDGASLSVDGAGIEPATHGFSVRCSTN